MAVPSDPTKSAAPYATLEANIEHLPESEKARQRDAGKGATLHLGDPQRFRKLTPHPDPSIPPTTIEVTAQTIEVQPPGSTWQLVTEDGPMHAVTGDILVTDPWNKQWIVSAASFAAQGHTPVGPAEQPEHLRDDA